MHQINEHLPNWSSHGSTGVSSRQSKETTGQTRQNDPAEVRNQTKGPTVASNLALGTRCLRFLLLPAVADRPRNQHTIRSVLLSEIKESDGLKLPYRASSVIPAEVRALLPSNPAPLLIHEPVINGSE